MRAAKTRTRWTIGLIVLLVAIGTETRAQSCDDTPDHFAFTPNTGETFSIVLDSVSTACSLAPCDEIAVYDGALCVGATVYHGSWPLAIIAWGNDPQTGEVDGYICGHTMSFKIWRALDSQVSDVQVSMVSGSGPFCDGPFARLWAQCADPCGLDVTAPVLDCPSSLVVGTDAGQCDAVVSFNVSATDDCDASPLISVDPLPGSVFPRGVSTVHATATDDMGNQSECSFTITVEDLEPPVITCSVDTIVLAPSGSGGVTVNFTPPVYNDNCPGAWLQCTPSSGSYFTVGTTVVDCIARDSAQNSSSCSFNVTVNLGDPCDMMPDHFAFADNTGDSYSIVVDSLSGTCGGQLQPCDEVGVFDGGLCVGAAVFNGSWPLALVAWGDDPQTGTVDGYSCGSAMSFKIWRNGDNQFVDAAANMVSGDGTFCNGAYSRLWLGCTIGRAIDDCGTLMPSDGTGDCLIFDSDHNGQIPVASGLSGYDVFARVRIQGYVAVCGAQACAGGPECLNVEYIEYCDSCNSPQLELCGVVDYDPGTDQFTLIESENPLPSIVVTCLPSEVLMPWVGQRARLAGCLIASGFEVFHLCALSIQACEANCDQTPDHFQFRSGTQDSYSIVVDSTALSCTLSPCDEIAIFDGDLCVGATVFDGQWPLALTAWADDSQTPTKDGYACGNPLSFRIWHAGESCKDWNATPMLVFGGGNFCDGAFSRLWMQCGLGCECLCHSDPNCDCVVNVFDVTIVINVAFRGAPPVPDSSITCPVTTTDVNCDGVTNIFDVTHLVNVAFRGFDRAAEFCDPCAGQ